MVDQRLVEATRWLSGYFSTPFEIRPLAGDASFRRYFRVFNQKARYVLMDAPPGKEDTAPFLKVRAWLHEHGLHTPELVTMNQQQGFLLLEDFGDITWASHLAAGGDCRPLFEDALHQLELLQNTSMDGMELPQFNVARMQRECDLYLDWYLPKVAGYEVDKDARDLFHKSLAPYLEQLHVLPKVAVHLDFHSRNLMIPDSGMPLGVIDFQDAVAGPATYDLASLLYDCYQDYPEADRRYWSRRFYERLPKELAEHFESFDQWHRAVRLTALQRHIKATGIFARLAYRDGKMQFLGEIPLTRKHLLEEMEALGISQPLLSREPLVG